MGQQILRLMKLYIIQKIVKREIKNKIVSIEYKTNLIKEMNDLKESLKLILKLKT